MESSDDASGSSGERVHAVTASDGEEKDVRSRKGESNKQRQVSGARGAEHSSWLAVVPIAALFILSVACATLGPVPLNKSAWIFVGSFALGVAALNQLVLRAAWSKQDLRARDSSAIFPSSFILLAVVVSMYAATFWDVYTGAWYAELYAMRWEVLSVCNVLTLVLALVLLLSAMRESSQSGIVARFLFGVKRSPKLLGVLDMKRVFYMRWPMLLGLLFAVASALEQMRQFPEAFSPPMLLWLSSLYTMAVTYIWFEEEHVFSRSVQSEAVGWWFVARNCVGWPAFVVIQSSVLVAPPDDIAIPPPVMVFAVLMWVVGWSVSRGAMHQKHIFKSQGPSAIIWGERPLVIVSPRDSMKRLLISGWWGIIRRPTLAGDLLMLVAMTCSAMTVSPLLVLTWSTLFAVVLLVRCVRDEAGLMEEYGSVWAGYCKRVPYRFIPFVF